MRLALRASPGLGCGWVRDRIDTIRSVPERVAIALTHRNFRLLWFGALTSSVGTWMQRAAQAWLIVTMTGSRSAVYLGFDSFLGEFPLLLFLMLGGVFADRRDRRHMILMSQLAQMLVAFVLAALVYARHIRVAEVLALSSVVGCARAFGGPAYQALLPTLVRTEHLPNAIALNSIQVNLARIIGPIAAGAALAAFGMAACFGLNCIFFLFVIAAILALRDVDVPRPGTRSMFAQFRSSLRYVQGSSNLVAVMALGFFCAFFGEPLLTFLPVVTRDLFHRGVDFYTYLMTFSGAGAAMGALVVAWLGKNKHMGRVLRVSLTLLGAMIAGFGLSRATWLSVSILCVGGSLFVICTSLATSLAHLLAPRAFGGRVISVYLVALLGGAPLGGLASGWLITRVGSARVMLVVNGAALMFVGAHFLIHGPGREMSGNFGGRSDWDDD